MPGLEEYPIYRNISIADLQEKMASFDRIDEKFEFMYHYLLSYGMEGSEADCTFEELLHAGKEAFLKASLAAKDEYARNRPNLASPDRSVIDPYHDNELDNDTINQRYFLKNPVDFMRQASGKVAEIQVLPTLTEEEANVVESWKANQSRIKQRLDALQSNFGVYEEDAVPGDILRNVGEKVYERADITPEEILARNKGGFWENFRGTTSQEYKDFEKAYQSYNNPDDPGWKDKAALREASMAYIRHKFPSLEEGKLPTPEQIAALKSPTARGRTNLCVAMVQELELQNRIQEMNDYWAEANHEIDQPGFANKIEFQDQLAQDLDESEQSYGYQDEPEEAQEKNIENDFSIAESDLSDNSF